MLVFGGGVRLRLDKEVLLLEARARAKLVRILAQIVARFTITTGLDDLQRTVPMGEATLGAERGKADRGRLGDALLAALGVHRQRVCHFDDIVQL